MKSNNIIAVCYVILILLSTGFCQTGVVNKTYTFPADYQPWQPTGIDVVKNQPITISATGTWTADLLGPPGTADCSADGHPGSTPDRILRAGIYSGGNRVFMKLVGSSSKFEAPADGELRFGHDIYESMNGNAHGNIVINITLEPAPITIALPGMPRNNSGGGISGPPTVDEDRVYRWFGVGETTVTIATGTTVTYRFIFEDQYAPDFSRTFDPFAVPDIIAELYADHKFKESGIYGIKLEIDYTDADTKQVETLKAGPYQVVVVDHLPVFIGAAVFMIKGPGKQVDGNLDDRGMTGINYLNTDVIYEDIIVDSRGNKAWFYINALLKLYAELPEGEDTGSDADRYEGIIPESARYQIDWGDGIKSAWIPFTQVNDAQLNDPADFNVSRPFMSSPFFHMYETPGSYEMKVTLGYKCVKYEPKMANGVVYSYTKNLNTPEQFTVKTRNVLVADETPPYIPPAQIRDIEATTGDPVKLEFFVDDNHKEKDIVSALLFMEKKPKSNDFKQITLGIEKQGPSSRRGQTFRIFTDEWYPPADVAVKKVDPDNFLKYYIHLKDREGNENKGWSNVKEDFPPRYLENGAPVFSTGRILITDNDPPHIVFTVEVSGKTVAVYEISDSINDFTVNDFTYGKLKVVEKKLTVKSMQYEDKAQNSYTPGSVLWETPSSCFSEVEVPEKFRFYVNVSTYDNVDKFAEKIMFGFEGNEQVADLKNGNAKFSYVPNQTGDFNFIIQAEDRENMNSKKSYRRVNIPVKVIDTSIFFKTIGR